MEFKDWLKNDIPGIHDAYESFMDIVFSGEIDLNEAAGPMIFKAEFVLEEARKIKEDKPWGNEQWLDKNPKIEKTASVNAFRTRDEKGVLKELVFEPYLINLLPAKQSGINMCMCATKECAATCLHTAGNIGALMDKTMSRLRKSWFLALDRDKAFEQITKNIYKKKEKVDEFNRKSKKRRKQMIVRLNGTSDIIWRTITGQGGKNLFEMFPDIVFYDYSKMDEVKHFLKGEIIDKDGRSLGKFPPNYHLTLSYGGPHGMDNYRDVLMNGENLAVPFGPGKTASLDFMEFPKDIRELIKKKIYYPDHIEKMKRGKDKNRAKDEYLDMVVEEIKKNGDFVSPQELAPFAGQTLLPGLFMCHEVIDGDDYDARFLDDLMLPRMNMPNDSERAPDMELNRWERKRKKHGIIIGLTAKGDLTFSAYKKSGWDVKHTGFMVGPEDGELNSQCRPMLNDPSKEAFLRKKTEVYKKVARAIITMRNFDARHVHSRDASGLGAFGRDPRTHIQRGTAKPVQTYVSTKGRTTREMNDLIGVIHQVMQGMNPNITKGNIKKMQSAAQAAAKLRKHLMDPKTIQMLNDENFKRRSREIGIDVNFDSLAKMVDMDARRDPQGAKRTLLPQDILKSLGKSPEEV